MQLSAGKTTRMVFYYKIQNEGAGIKSKNMCGISKTNQSIPFLHKKQKPVTVLERSDFDHKESLTNVC